MAPAAAPIRAAIPPSVASAWWRGLKINDLHGAPFDTRARWLVVVFLGQECPVSNASIPVLNRLSAEFSRRDVAFIGAYVDPTASLESLSAHASDFAIGFHTADDRGHRLSSIAGATYTPEAVIFTSSGDRLYAGRIDDRVDVSGASRPAAAHEELREALIALAAGLPIPSTGKAGYGCAIPEAVHP